MLKKYIIHRSFIHNSTHTNKNKKTRSKIYRANKLSIMLLENKSKMVYYNERRRNLAVWKKSVNDNERPSPMCVRKGKFMRGMFRFELFGIDARSDQLH